MTYLWKELRFCSEKKVSLIPQQAFQRCFNVVFWLIWRHDVVQPQINVETTLCISTFDFTKSNQRCVFQRCDMSNIRHCRNNVVLFNFEFHNFSQRGNNVLKMTISERNRKKIISDYIHWIRSFYRFFITFFTLHPTLRRLCWMIFAKLQNLGSWKILHCKNLIQTASLCNISIVN